MLSSHTHKHIHIHTHEIPLLALLQIFLLYNHESIITIRNKKNVYTPSEQHSGVSIVGPSVLKISLPGISILDMSTKSTMSLFCDPCKL